jgi:hypothetical protein
MINVKIYDIDLQVLAKNLIPIGWLNYPWFAPWVKSLTVPLSWLKNKFFVDSLNGINANVYDVGTSYIIGNKVKYGQSIYECIQDTTGNNPTNSLYWVLYVSDRIGTRERLGYSCEQLKLEYALNRRYETDFRQPTSGGLRPDIYIGLNNVVSQFTIYTTTANNVFTTSSDGFIYTEEVNQNDNNITIYVPDIALFTNMGSELTQIVGNYVKKYICESINFNVQTYAGLPPTY